MNFLKTIKKGAVFGIDARVSLVILAIVSLAIAMNRLSANESENLKQATLNILKLSDHITQQYKTYHDDIANIQTIYSATSAQQDKFWARADYLKLDPWGNQWKFIVRSAESENVVAFNEPIAPKCIIIFSAGADGYHYLHTQYSGTTYSQCINNTDLTIANNSTEKHDDLFYKFTTIGYEVKANVTVKKYLEDIQQALANYELAEKNLRLKHCDDQTQADANLDAKCDINGDGTYTPSELDNLNYYPKSSLDTTANVKYADNKSYQMKNLNDRKQFLAKIGLPEEYNEDPIGRALYYHSNKDLQTATPYIAEFKYQQCADCEFE